LHNNSPYFFFVILNLKQKSKSQKLLYSIVIENKIKKFHTIFIEGYFEPKRDVSIRVIDDKKAPASHHFFSYNNSIPPCCFTRLTRKGVLIKRMAV